MARQECDYLDNVDLTQERFIGVFNGSPLYEKWYTGTVNVTGTQQVTKIDTDATKHYRTIVGTFQLSVQDQEIIITNASEPNGTYRFSCQKYGTEGLELVYFTTIAGYQGTATYTVCAQYTK
jgi:hypothetical protein